MCALNKKQISRIPDNNGSGHPVSIDMIDFNPSWQFEDSKTGVFYKNGVIPHKLFITYLGGNIHLDSAKKALEILENMFKSGVLSNCQYIRIADYSEVSSASFNTRILYANTLNRLNSEYHCQPLITYISGASLLLKTMLRLFATYVKQKFIFVSTVQEALTLINASPNHAITETDHPITISQKEIDHFASLCGQILFNETFTFDEKLNGVSPDNPLHNLYTIISLLNHDLKELQKTEKQQTQKIEEALTESQMLNDRLSVEKKNVEEKEQIQKILIENLKKAIAEAEIANQAKSEFLANISHEIITPLHAVIGMTDLLCRTQLNGEQKNYANTIQKSSQHLHLLLNNILDFSKNESGQLDKEKSIFDIRTLLDDISAFLIDSALTKKLFLTFNIPSSIPAMLSGYPAYLQQSMINLVQNAIKFSNEGEIVVSIEPVTETPHNIDLRISVKDHGIGIPENKKELVFDKFTQLDSSATRKEGGAGLGLAISKQLIEFMGGKLNLISQENEGSEFWFQLSFTKVKENTNTPDTDSTKRNSYSAPFTPLQPSETTLPSNTRVLLVEDNIINQRVAIAMLNKLGCTVDIAANGIEAIDALKQQPYALVIMDLQMPVMGGIEATKEIRKKETGIINPDIPVIAMTANATSQDKKTCLYAGMNDFISKPVVMPTLQELLKKWVQ